MSRGSTQHGERFEAHITVAAPPAVVFGCFFKPEALRAWWQVVRSVTTPVPFGVFAVEWATTPYRDELLGALGGVLHGTVVDVRPGQRFFVADVYWVPPEGDPIGPMALHVTCDPDPTGCRLQVLQEGYEPSPRWRRYYAVISRAWEISLSALKRYVETPPPAAAPGPPKSPPGPQKS
jgi:uncharacterized protein YndB with AHSA1/START domain